MCAAATRISPDYRPTTPAELQTALADPMWRISSGYLYKIIVKAPDRDTGASVVNFRPNQAQLNFLDEIHNRSIILKCRQLGFSTLISLIWLDHALFVRDQRCGIVAQDRETAENIFRDKIKFAYDNLPTEIRRVMPLARDTATELLFAHTNSSIRVATSVRGGTYNRLHVSEFGKICQKYPDKAEEVVTGSLPAVPADGIAVIESTGEGAFGRFYEMTKRAEALQQQKKRLSNADWKLCFYPWQTAPDYEQDPDGVIITPRDHEYFDGIEGKTGVKISLRQRAWYCARRDGDFAGDQEAMLRQYPSTPDEPFLTSTEGTYYAAQLAQARKEGRVGRVPHVSHVPVNTFWDIGSHDGTAIWFHQKIGAEHRFIAFDEAWGEPYGYFIQRMQNRGWIWGTHYLPHDAQHQRQQGRRVQSPIQMLQELAPGWRFEIVDRVDDINNGIQLVRSRFSQCWFDETNCSQGLTHLSLYRKTWNERLAVWSDRPMHNEHSEAADAFRQFAQGWRDHAVRAGTIPKRRNRSGIAA